MENEEQQAPVSTELMKSGPVMGTTRTMLHVKVGDDHWHPSPEEIETIRKKFEDANVADVVVGTDSRVSVDHTTFYLENK